ncbi:IS1096 element passenger TnpR family protein [Halobacillus alkaliphilus]
MDIGTLRRSSLTLGNSVKQGDTILYVYDYGEEWRVKIKVEENIEG